MSFLISFLFPNTGTSVPLHLVAQNAGVILTKSPSGISFEAFELSPRNKDVVSTEGRLQRDFPGPALSIPTFTFDNPQFQSTFAATLSTMSFQKAVGMTPKVRKSGNEVEENRDTTHPGLVTELLVSFLSPLSTPINAQRICKFTREEVMWEKALLPWRRSPLWLLLRVTIQLKLASCHANTASPELGTRTYKLFILHILATVLDISLRSEKDMEAEKIHCMVAKLVGRILKLNPDEIGDGPSIPFVKQVLETAKTHLEQRLAALHYVMSEHVDLDHLKNLDFKKDVTLRLPQLDIFRRQVGARVSFPTTSDFSPSSDLWYFPALSLPKGLQSTCVVDYEAYNIFSFENWVSRHLSSWTSDHLHDAGACASTLSLMKDYHRRACPLYLNNPETASVMILTLLELWVACDKCAVAHLPMLAEYDPGFPLGHLRVLILPMRDHMVRLRAVEEYLEARMRNGQKYGGPGSIFKDFGVPSSFSVRFFAQSSKHLAIRQAIEERAADRAEKKKEELAQLKQEYNEHQRMAEKLTCDQVSVRDVEGNHTLAHSMNRRRHAHLSAAEAIVIDAYEWPLPRDDGPLKSVVFEMDPPTAFCEWRDSTIFLLQNVLGSEYTAGGYKNPYRCLLQQYSTQCDLKEYYKAGSPRISLCSAVKPHANTHRYRGTAITTATDTDVCVNNGLEFRYYDTSLQSFTTRMISRDSVLKQCTYEMLNESKALQQFLRRGFKGQDSTPNHVISTQSDCPPHMSLAEYRSLASIPIGHRIQWQNILVQISCPITDFKKPENSLVIFQSIYQAGPPDADNIHRAGHSVLAEEKFTRAIIRAIYDAVGRIEQNWESLYALGILASITCRQLSMASDPALVTDALCLLSSLRKTAFTWVQSLRSKYQQAQSDTQRMEFCDKLVEAALICCVTFDTEDTHLETVLPQPCQASILLQCHTLLHDHCPSETPERKTELRPLFRRRWQKLMLRAYPIFARLVLQEKKAACLDEAVKIFWDEYEPGPGWKLAEPNIDYWVTRDIRVDSNRTFSVHYNLLLGTLLLNGKPISRLPPEYERHPVYRELLGNTVLDVVPSLVPGMSFCAQQPHQGHFVHFGMQGTDLVLHATRNGCVLNSVPREAFRGDLPDTFVDDFFHWYEVRTKTVLFRDRGSPWEEAKSTWKLSRSDMGWPGWVLEKDGTKLVATRSITGKALTTIFAPLQTPLQINLTVDPKGKLLEIELPRLQLEFCLGSGTTSVASRKLRGLEVDSDQSIGTLLGLKTKLVLTNPSNHDRKVLIPFGEVSASLQHDHVSTCINPIAASPYIYKVDQILQRLTDSGSLQSKLFLCYLHGLSSFCLPDPLTCRTGTEQALSILKGAAVKSFPILTEENLALLEKIDSLTPRRFYYPAGEKVMQMVNWRPEFPSLSQHSHFHLAIEELFSHYKLARLYYPDAYVEPPSIEGIAPSLLRRELSRSSKFRISCFGSEDFSKSSDAIYSARDWGQSSDRAREAQILSAMLYHRNGLLHLRKSCPPNLASHILGVFKKSATGKVQGPMNPSTSSATLAYDSRWLEDKQPDYWAELWCWMHAMAREQPLAPKIQKFQVMMWFSTMAFAEKTDIAMLHAAAAMFLIPAVQAVQPVPRPFFSLSQGWSADDDALKVILYQAAWSIDRSPERTLVKAEYESLRSWKKRRTNLHRKNLENAVGQLASSLSQQFPTTNPYPPTGPNCRYVNVDKAMAIITTCFVTWDDNRLFHQYIQDFVQSINEQTFTNFEVQALQYEPAALRTSLPYHAISPKDFFSCEPKQPLMDCARLQNGELLSKHIMLPSQSDALKALVHKLERRVGSKYEQQYTRELRQSASKLTTGSHSLEHVLSMSQDQLRIVLNGHLSKSQEHMKRVFDSIATSIRTGLGTRSFALEYWQTPRLSSTFLLQQLSKHGWAVGGG